MRLGINIDWGHLGPEDWIAHVLELGLSAVTAPMRDGDSPQVVRRYLELIREHDLVIGEVGVWKNTIAPDETERRAAVELAKSRLALAEEIGANCCVNTAGSAGANWAGYYDNNLTADTWALIVDTTREILDSVKPTRTWFTLEPMPWIAPDSPDSYLALIRDIDRPRMGVHLDYINMINGIGRFCNRAAFIRECFDKLGPLTRSIHAKDIALQSGMPCNLQECAPGQGVVDFAEVLRQAEALGPDIPVFVEHLSAPEEIEAALGHLRGVAKGCGVTIK